jgi:trypsin
VPRAGVRNPSVAWGHATGELGGLAERPGVVPPRWGPQVAAGLETLRARWPPGRGQTGEKAAPKRSGPALARCPRMTKAGHFALAALACGWGAACVQPPAEQQGSSIYQGQVRVHPRVGLLSFPREWNHKTLWTKCTGVVVSPHVVITAAHCMALLPFPDMPDDVRPYTLPPRAIVFQSGASVQQCLEIKRAREAAGEPPIPCGSWYQAMEEGGFYINREYIDSHDLGRTGCFDPMHYLDTGEVSTNGPCYTDLTRPETAYVRGDLAAVHFDRMGIKVDPATPISLASSAPGVGQPVDVWGFGTTATTLHDVGESRVTSTVVRRLYDDKVMILDGPRTTTAGAIRGAVCHGDSGGPTFSEGSGILMGIHSTGGPQAECGYESWDIRVDTYRPWICNEIREAHDPLPPGCESTAAPAAAQPAGGDGGEGEGEGEAPAGSAGGDPGSGSYGGEGEGEFGGESPSCQCTADCGYYGDCCWSC